MTQGPDDFGGPAKMIEAMGQDESLYRELMPLAQRGATSVKLSRPQGDDDGELYRKFGFSIPIIKMHQLGTKLYGYMRDGHVTDPDEKAAIMGSNALNDLILESPCVTREERYNEEETRAQGWIKLIGGSVGRGSFPRDPYSADRNGHCAEEDMDEGSHEDGAEEDMDGEPLEAGAGRTAIDYLLDEWGEADAFMLQCRIDEERYGIDYAAQHYDDYDRMEAKRRETEMRASQLPPAENMLFWCRVRQYQVMRERALDLAMGYPVQDYSQVKQDIAKGADVHDIAPRLPWAFNIGYQRVLGSMLDGQEHRLQMISMNAQQIPAQPQQMPWGLPPGYWGGQQPWGNGPAGGGPPTPGEDGQQPDKRPALMSFFGGRGNAPQNGAQPEQKKSSKRQRRAGR